MNKVISIVPGEFKYNFKANALAVCFLVYIYAYLVIFNKEATSVIQ